jgi:hypothetical protein
MHHNKAAYPKQLKKFVNEFTAHKLLELFDFMNMQRRTLPHPCPKKIKSISLPPTNPNTSCQLIREEKKTPATADTNQAHSTRKQQTITKFTTQLQQMFLFKDSQLQKK